MKKLSQAAIRVRDRIRVVIAEEMDGLPVTINRMGIRINPDATLAERKAIADILLTVHEGSNCETRFAMGDWWLSLGEEYGDKVGELRDMYGALPNFDRIYADFRDAGWIAKKWPPLMRKEFCSWNWHKENEPDCLRTKEEKDSVKTDSQTMSTVVDIVLSGKHSRNIVNATFNAQTQVFKAEIKWGQHTFPVWQELVHPQLAFAFTPPEQEQEDNEEDAFASSEL